MFKFKPSILKIKDIKKIAQIVWLLSLLVFVLVVLAGTYMVWQQANDYSELLTTTENTIQRPTSNNKKLQILLDMQAWLQSNEVKMRTLFTVEPGQDTIDKDNQDARNN